MGYRADIFVSEIEPMRKKRKKGRNVSIMHGWTYIVVIRKLQNMGECYRL